MSAHLNSLFQLAWQARANARTRGERKVGAAVLASDGTIYVGCNIQQKYHSSDLHAEIVAIAAMISAGRSMIETIVVASDREGIAPCGACRDWILEYGEADCLVAWEGESSDSRTAYVASELLPAHPPYN